MSNDITNKRIEVLQFLRSIPADHQLIGTYGYIDPDEGFQGCALGAIASAVCKDIALNSAASINWNYGNKSIDISSELAKEIVYWNDTYELSFTEIADRLQNIWGL